MSRTSRDISTPGLGGHIATSGCQLLSQSFKATFFDLVVIENLTVAVVNDHIVFFYLNMYGFF